MFPSPCGVKKLKLSLKDFLKNTELVSVPLRGKKIETQWRLPIAIKDLFVSVPLRGKKIETFTLSFRHVGWVSVPLRGKKIETQSLTVASGETVSVPLRGKKIETIESHQDIIWNPCFRPLAG